MSLPEITDTPMESDAPIDGSERRFEELALLQRMIAERDARLDALETEIELLRRAPYGGPAGQVQDQIEKLALQADVDRLSRALIEKEQARFMSVERLRALTEDHGRLAHDLEQLRDPDSHAGQAIAASRADLVFEIEGLHQTIAHQRAALDSAEAKFDRVRLSEPFDGEGSDNDGMAARAERRMRRQQMAMLSAMMAKLPGRADQNG